ncbi:hydroxymethylglutaryl-CoA reductase, degradative [Candidatus Aciduliprofundum boonei]|uniref:3-hydroxy-3-methylglutaryl coenzyme A reductase n=1 Tax=Aciduliprofundum boonei (strain DSM 19572 / T469) TaxID=439481 RepID=B5ICX3_ACIB4|nr:hydroxymethylglutaryl-CoA reductase, degradative [Candidatus Aciduliprofundum boonei]ADD09267.1 hydroxymethylglutaryl-CoA reductase, degradative [Aciduliprofundum boonei T469]EDY35824.1 hydroxymethylglutaryl-CoA reductase, degradative [Aciduliprofundum boonei T469]HII54843.1 hydroxymethylglutaryl-CoA reductase, degradative [Candidatus Aciduliprofundum boonei]
MKSSRISGFYKLSIEERLKIVKEFSELSDEEAEFLLKGHLDMDLADRMIENVVGMTELPIGIATNFKINGKDYLIPMAIEEPSVVAAASHAAKLAREGGGFFTSSTEPIMISQIQVVGLRNPHFAKMQVLEHKEELMRIANEQDPVLIKVGGGCRDIKARVIDSNMGPMLVIHLHVDVRDAMGANAVNSMAEALAPYIEDITGGKVYLRILSNLAIYRLARARAVWKKDVIGEDTVKGILYAYEFARVDPFRAATHNKGIMNGIDAVLIATSNDWRAVEAGAHAFAAMDGWYTSLTHYEEDEEGNLVGSIELPMAVGIIGGATSTHPKAKIARKILGIKTAKEFGEILAAVGLAQNFAALRALATEGIQRGHMSLHARNIAVMAGAKGEEIDRVAELLVKEKKVRVDRAKEILEELRERK